MKRPTTATQPGKANEVKAELPSTHVRKVIYEHKPCDHHYGRGNKHAIGINHEPGLFH
jgi:hypothetical protein